MSAPVGLSAMNSHPKKTILLIIPRSLLQEPQLYLLRISKLRHDLNRPSSFFIILISFQIEKDDIR